MELNLTQKQVQTLSPQMMQSMEILQMGSQELLEYIEEAVQENPVLEPEETYDKQDEFSVLRRKLEWLESTDPQNRYYHQQDTEEEDSPLNNFGTVQDDDENLYYYVLSQLRVLELEPEVMDAGVFLVESLNQNGWLDEPLEALAAGHGCGPEVMAQALEVVQSLEPAGVGARDRSKLTTAWLLISSTVIARVPSFRQRCSASNMREARTMPEHTAAPSEQTAPMRLAKILDSFIPGMHDTPCRIAIFTDGRKIKVFEKVYFRRPAFDPPLPQTWERNYWLERYQTPQAVENHLQKNGLLKENSHE